MATVRLPPGRLAVWLIASARAVELKTARSRTTCNKRFMKDLHS
jgi:hypothetical protein